MKRGDLALAVLVWACFAGVVLYRTSLPGINEPQYLCKAKHFYAPEWCARDMFLDSANAHWVFYAVIGPLTRIATLDQTAVIGRALAWACLAWSWVRLARLWLTGRWSPVVAACLFLCLQAWGNFSGEWVVGGVEAKCFAYTALLHALAGVCEKSYRQAAAALGLAISFHPVVGAWGAICLGLAQAGPMIAAWWPARPSLPSRSAEEFTPPASRARAFIREWGVPGLLCLGLSLPGLIPALQMIATVPSTELARQADAIQVFERLDHHLDPTDFPRANYVLYAVGLVLWLPWAWLRRSSRPQCVFARFVLATLFIASAGLVVGIVFRSAGLMKFYPFRLFDLFLPLAVALAATEMLECLFASPRWAAHSKGARLAAWAGPVVAGLALLGALRAPGKYSNPSHMQPDNWMAFVDACHWIDEHTPADALFLTGRMNVGFKWYAQRAEYVTWKDCPQDAAGILEWKRRLQQIKAWRAESAEDGISAEEAAALAADTGIDYVLTWYTEAWQIEPVYRNSALCVYRLAK
ncbi:MAG: hypothetical protein JSS02_26545 [Planctomycetes bacterium]|nr:hypothetical protein [Planctomycetota bacterium]